MIKCFCGSSVDFQNCCGMFHSGLALPSTALLLMKSRYAAFASANVDYILKTERLQHPNNRAELEQWCSQTQWIKLEILHTSNGQINQSSGTVTFEATYIFDGQIHKMKEKSFFKFIDGMWIYVGVK